MGRYVYESGNFVWKYVFAGQNSEQSKIAEELQIGTCEEGEEPDDEGNGFYGDILTLDREDIPKLEAYLKDTFEPVKEHETVLREGIKRKDILKCYHAQSKLFNGYRCNDKFPEKRINTAIKEVFPDIYFWAMIEAYIKYMKKHKDQSSFSFEGEF
jgi:hypothetical protein